MTRKHTLLLLIPLGLGVLVAGCGDDEEEAETSANVSAGIGGAAWILDNDSIDVEVPATMEEITLAFTTDGSFAGHAGCNNYTGSLHDHPRRRSHPRRTRGHAHDVRGATSWPPRPPIAEFVQVTSYAIDGSELTLSGADGELLTYEAESGPVVVMDEAERRECLKRTGLQCQRPGHRARDLPRRCCARVSAVGERFEGIVNFRDGGGITR